MGDNAAVSQTTAAKKTIPCEECGKPLASKQSLTNHVLKIHRKVVETSRSPLIQSTSSAVTSAAPAPAPAPPSTPAPPSLPGPSSAAPDSMTTPANIAAPGSLTTPASMAAPAAKPRQLFSPGTEDALQEDEEVMEEAKEEQDLYDELDLITQNVIDPEKEKETRDDMKLKLTRYRNIMNKKNILIQEASEKVKALEHDAKMRSEVEERNKIQFEEKDAEKAILKSQVKKVEKEHEKSKAQYKVDLDLLRESVSELTKSNNDLKESIKTKEAYVASLTEELTGDGDVESTSANEEVDVVADVHHEENIIRVTMNKETPIQKCLACDKVFKANSDLEKHIRDKHTEPNCHMCDKKFSTKKQVEEHICSNTNSEVVPQVCKKTYCQKEFVSTAALNKHIKSNHFGNQRSVCHKCEEILSNNDLKKHMESCGKSSNEAWQVKEKSNIVCKHWRRGHCNMGNECGFSHVGYQNTLRSENLSTGSTRKPCRNGPSCSYLARGRCNFKHHNNNKHQGVQQAGESTQPVQRPAVRSRQEQGSRRQQCRFGARCDMVVNCPNLHSTQDFPQYNTNQRFHKTNQNNRNRF